MRWMLVLLMLVASPCLADEEEAIAALVSAGFKVKELKDGEREIGITDVNGHRVNPAKAARIAEVANVKRIVFEMRNPEYDREILKKIVTIDGVRYLEITGQGFSDKDMDIVATMPGIQNVVASYSDLTDDGLLRLAKCKSLRYVHIYSRYITQDAKEKLNELLPKCVVK